MRTDQFLQYLDQGLFLLIFVATAIEAVRRPARVKADIALFFGVCALLILEAWLLAALHVRPGPVLTALTSSALMALPYLLHAGVLARRVEETLAPLAFRAGVPLVALPHIGNGPALVELVASRLEALR